MFANPELFSDNKKGFTGVLKRVGFSLVLLAFVPSIFNYAFKLQYLIINNNVIERTSQKY